MKKFTTRRIVSVLVGMVLPVALILVILFNAMQHSYLKAADSFGQEFGLSMAQQAKNSVQTATDENWNSVNIAAAGLPANFADYSSAQKEAWLKNIAAAQQGRGATFFYYSQSGECVGSDGTISVMRYTSRADISSVLAGTDARTLYGPLFEDSAADDEAAAAGTTAERSGYTIYYTVPVKDAAGTVLGALSLRRDAYEYCDAISGLSLGEGGYTCIYDSTGAVIAVSRNEKLALVNGQELIAPMAAAQEKIAARKELGTGAGQLITGAEYDGTDAMIVYQPLAEADETDSAELQGWGILTYLPNADLEGYLIAQASSDVAGNWVTWLAVVLLVALAVFYLAMDAMRARREEAERKMRENKDILDQTLRALAGTYEARTTLSRGHGYRVGAYAREIGRHMELSETELQRLYFEAVLHDIGMVGVPEAVLQHQAEQKLTAEEGQQLRAHVTVGGRILGKLTALPGINVGAMYHHQHYDGNGYCSSDAMPAKGDAIPLSARIITVADHYDDFVASGKENVDLLLENDKGKQFDPLLADIMIQLIRDGTAMRLYSETEDALRNGGAELAEV